VSLYLAIDTATDIGSVAVGEPGRTVSEVVFTDRRHAAALVPAVEEVLRLAGAGYGDLTGLAVADGPGSFTGLRIGFATAKGILRVHEGLVLRTAPSLLATAWVAQRYVAGPVAALYDALRGEVFGAVYAREGDAVRTLVAPVRSTPEALAERAPVRPVLAVGDGAVAHAAAMQAWTGREPLGPPAGAPKAGALIELLALEGAAVLVADPAAFEPAYGRQAAAQDKWEQRHGRPLPHSGGDPR
jgi:tRNA threonylcarbamoyladenosine biosynthesis protein TsaB